LVLTENVEVAVISPDFEKQIAGAIPLVDDFFDTIGLFAQVKAHRTFVSFASRVAFDPQFHREIILPDRHLF